MKFSYTDFFTKLFFSSITLEDFGCTTVCKTYTLSDLSFPTAWKLEQYTHLFFLSFFPKIFIKNNIFSTGYTMTNIPCLTSYKPFSFFASSGDLIVHKCRFLSFHIVFIPKMTSFLPFSKKYYRHHLLIWMFWDIIPKRWKSRFSKIWYQFNIILFFFWYHM